MLFLIVLAIIPFLFAIYYYFVNGEEEDISPSQKSIIYLIAYTMRADGKLSKRELNAVKEFLLANFNEKRSKKLLLLLRDVLKSNQSILDIRPICMKINQSISYKGKISILSLLFKISYASGDITQKEYEIIKLYSRFTCIKNSDFRNIAQLYFNFKYQQSKQNYEYKNHESNNYKNTYSTKKWAFDELGLPETASQDEIKKSFRQLAKKYHPDKLNNLSEREISYATEKFRKIKNAYESLIEN